VRPVELTPPPLKRVTRWSERFFSIRGVSYRRRRRDAPSEATAVGSGEEVAVEELESGFARCMDGFSMMGFRRRAL
jgi:hypothetical protein